MLRAIIYRLLLPLFMLLAGNTNAQKKDSGYIKGKKYYPAIRFMVNAPTLLPALHKAGKLTDMQNFADNWGNSPAPSDEFSLAINTLLAAENKNLSIRKMPWDYKRLLDDYAKELQKAGNSPEKFKYYIKLPGVIYRYDATSDAIKLLLFMRDWAKHVLAGHITDSTTSFICNVFAGNITKPSAYYKANKFSYVEMASFDNSIDSVQQQCFVAKRDKLVGTLHVLAGVWMPNGNLSLLGPHPSVGLQFGVRNKMNEFDLTWNFRFLPPTPQIYTVLRHDTLYNSNYYDGGYIGFDYTRYVVHKTKFEAGFIGGIGYDYFDAFNGISGHNTGHDYQPYNIGSLDINFGLHLKYFIGKGPSIGIQAKYHCINYVNQGGTDLSGNAVSIDLSFGAN